MTAPQRTLAKKLDEIAGKAAEAVRLGTATASSERAIIRAALAEAVEACAVECYARAKWWTTMGKRPYEDAKVAEAVACGDILHTAATGKEGEA